MVNINFGCGQFPQPGFLNVDFDPSTPCDVRLDLNDPFIGFKDGVADVIEARHVLEHLNNPFDAMREFHRILRRGGTLHIAVPHCSRGFVHPEHRRGFDVSFPLYFNKTFKGGYQHVEFRLVASRLSWFAQPELKKAYMNAITFGLVMLVARGIDLLANASPYLCSKVWCYWVGGFDQVEFTFEQV